MNYKVNNINKLPVADADYMILDHKLEVDCKKVIHENSMVVLVFGQSNAANAGDTRYTPKNNGVYNFFNNRCYKAEDPLLGTSGNGGSVWSRFSDKLLDLEVFDTIIFHTIAVGGTSIDKWTPSGELFKRIIFAKKQIDLIGLKYTHILFHQGEADVMRNTAYMDYKSSLEYIYSGLKQLNIDAPFFVSVVGSFGKNINNKIRFAQKEFVFENNNIFLGSNSDIINDKNDRYQIGHFTKNGLAKHSQQWVDIINKFKKEKANDK